MTLGGKLGHWFKGRSVCLGASPTHSMFCNDISFNKIFSPSVTLEVTKNGPHFSALYLLHVVVFRIVLVALDMCLLTYKCPVCT